MPADLIVVDDFYLDPIRVRQLALRSDFIPLEQLPRGHAASVTRKSFYSTELVRVFERLIGKPVVVDPRKHSFGTFAVSQENLGSPQTVHIDRSDWTGILYLKPGAPPAAGTRTFTHKGTRCSSLPPGEGYEGSVWQKDACAPERWDLNTQVANKFNRLVLIRSGKLFHQGARGFGNSRESGRLLQLFFFDEGIAR